MGFGWVSTSRCHRSSCVDEAPAEEASRGTAPVGSGAREASHEERRSAGSRSVPPALGAPEPKSRGAAPAQRLSDEHCSGAERPRALAVLTARRACSAVACAYPPEGQRVADGVQRVAHSPAYASGHDDQHRPARPAAVPPRGHGRGRRRLARLARPLHVAAPKPVAHDRNAAAWLMARSPAPGAARRTHRRAGRRPSCPKLDVDRGLDDPCVASLDCRQLPSAEHGGRTVLEHRPPTFCPSPCDGRLLRRPLLRRRTRSWPETRNLAAGDVDPARRTPLMQLARDPPLVPQLRCSVTRAG
jgi:hypothetical protein